MDGRNKDFNSNQSNTALVAKKKKKKKSKKKKETPINGFLPNEQ